MVYRIAVGMVENYHGINVMRVIIVVEIDENCSDFGMVLNELVFIILIVKVNIVINIIRIQ
jgi:hypothetical protein